MIVELPKFDLESATGEDAQACVEIMAAAAMAAVNDRPGVASAMLAAAFVRVSFRAGATPADIGQMLALVVKTEIRRLAVEACAAAEQKRKETGDDQATVEVCVDGVPAVVHGPGGSGVGGASS